MYEFICPRCGFDKSRLGRGLTEEEAHEGCCGLCHEEGGFEIPFNVWLPDEKLSETRCLFGKTIARKSNAKTIYDKQRGPPHENSKKPKKLLAEFGNVISHTAHHITIRDGDNDVICSWYPKAGKWTIKYTDRIGTFNDMLADLHNLKAGKWIEQFDDY